MTGELLCPAPAMRVESFLSQTAGARLFSRGIDVKFSSTEEFELHVHKCFGKIFELLQKVDAVVKEAADKEEAQNTCGVMCELRDWVEESILYCHLAWQYHRLSRVSSRNTWDRLENESSQTEKPSDKSG